MATPATTLRTLSGRPASQNGHELSAFIALLCEEGVRSYLEIGARHGDTFYEVMRALPKDAQGLAVDLPGGAWGSGTSRQALTRAINALKAEGWNKVACLFGDSHDANTIASIEAYGLWDAILIDGDHRYEGVLRDWQVYHRRARIVAFHDIAGEGQIEKSRGLPVEVPRLWRELRDQWQEHARRWVEIIDRDCGSRMGIGVLWQG